MSYQIWDTETNIRLFKKRKASPFHPDNAPVINITKRAKQPTKVEFLPRFYDKDAPKEFPLHLDGVKMLVGFNLKFDLLHCWEFPELQQWLKGGGRIWDCQYAEYLLEGQQPHAQMCSMDSIAEKYGGKLKPNMVKSYWDQGIDTTEIPIDLLKEYCDGDGDNPELIFLGQVRRAVKLGPRFIEMLKLRMDGLLATTEMEWNGLKVDAEKGEAQRESAQARLDKMDEELRQYIPELPDELEFNWSSRYHRSYLFFGGVAKYQKWVQDTDDDCNLVYAKKTEKWPLFDGLPVDPALCELGDSGLYLLSGDGPEGETKEQDTYQSGKRIGEGKTKNVTLPDYDKPKGAKRDHFFKFPGYTKPSPRWKASGEDGKGGPLYGTSSEVIEALGNRNVPFLKVFAERQKLDKDLGTYYWKEDKDGKRKGMLTLISEYDGMIHHKLNHDITVTTRLSSSDPNLQNLPRKDKSTVKELFISRFGDDGEMGELDYSQLEVIIQGWLSEDKNLRGDILSGIDFHCKRLAQKLQEPYELVKQKAKDENHEEYDVYSVRRTEVKGFSFQRAYGAGAEAISEATGMSVEDVKQLIEDERVLYPSIEKFNEGVAKSVSKSKQLTDEVIFTRKGPVKKGMGQWTAPTGTVYTFFESEAPGFLQERGIKASFSPPDMKNYPIQGTGGEVVQMVLGKLFRLHIKKDRYNNRARMVNTVHDCVWFDYRKEVRNAVLNDAIRVMQGIPTFLKKHFDIDCGVVFRVDAEYGPNMYNLHHFDSPYYIK